MRYEWDPDKDAENRRKHKVSFAQGIDALKDPESVFWIDERFDYGEERIITLGRSEIGILLAVTTDISEELTRIISVRQAEQHEEYWYYHGRP